MRYQDDQDAADDADRLPSNLVVDCPVHLAQYVRVFENQDCGLEGDAVLVEIASVLASSHSKRVVRIDSSVYTDSDPMPLSEKPVEVSSEQRNDPGSLL